MASQISPQPSSQSPGSQPSFRPPLLPTPPSPPSNNRSPSTPKATHVCDQCSRAFSRAEHLERHQTTHLPSTATKSFVCPSCGKGFTRKDVLTRHVRAVHETKKSDVRKSRRKSCRRCAAFKIKCTGGGKGKESGARAEEPCEACRKREVECIFDFGVQVNKNGEPVEEQEAEDDAGEFRSDEGSGGESTVGATAKRRKTNHETHTAGAGGQFSVSPHLLSAARLASSEGIRSEAASSTNGSKTDTQGMSMPHGFDQNAGAFERLHNGRSVVGGGSFPGMLRPERTGMHHDHLSSIYFPPFKDEPLLRQKSEQAHSMPASIAEEDLNAANTLRGIHSISSPTPENMSIGRPSLLGSGGGARPADSIRSTSLDPGTPLQRAPFASNYTLPGPSFTTSSPATSHLLSPQPSDRHLFKPVDPLPQQSDPPRTEPPSSVVSNPPSLDLADDDNFFFDFGIFDNSTDWLRDWGPNESISPESYSTGEGLSEAALAAALTPAPMEVDIPGLISGNESIRDIGSPRSIAASDHDFLGGHTPRLHPQPPPPTSHPEETRVLGLPSVAPLQNNAAGGDFLPWKRQEDQPSRKVTLPPLRVLLTEYNDPNPHPYPFPRTPADEMLPRSAGTVTEEMRKEMISVLALPSTRPPYPGYDSAELEKSFPTKDVIAGFVKLYFEEFHAMFPLIHRPSFCLERCPSMLLIAMVSIGASYSNLKNAKTFSDGLSELCKRCLSWLAENNPAYARSAFFLQSLCMQNLYAMGSGSTALYDAADVSRSILIGNARRIGLFSGDLSSSSSSPSSPPLDPLETRWRKWRESEGLKRLAWGIFEYDSSFSTLSNRRGAITLSDISIRIPCSEALWEAPTAAAWDALLAAGHEPRGLPFYKTLKDVISGAYNPVHLTSWGKRICAQAMGRIMWDFKELEESVLSVSATANTSFKPAKETLLSALMRVCDGCSHRPGDVDNDQYHWVLARLIAHYTHLHAAFPTVSRMLNLARRPPAKGEEPRDPRIKMLKQSFAADPVGARTLAYHAAQIIALSRWRPIFSPAEGMRLFLAGVVLWGFGNYYRRQRDGAEVVRLDLLPWATERWEESAREAEEWIRAGEKRAVVMGREGTVEVEGVEGVREVLRVVVGVLGSLRVWGLGGEFRSVLEELGTREAPA